MPKSTNSIDRNAEYLKRLREISAEQERLDARTRQRAKDNRAAANRNRADSPIDGLIDE